MKGTWIIHARGFHLHRGKPRRWLPWGKSIFHVVLGRYYFTLRAVHGRGICVVARCRTALRYSGDPGELKWEYPSMKKRITKAALANGVKHLAPVESNRFSDLMSLVEHCAVKVYDDGDPREPGWFTIKTNGAAWCVQVKDPDGCVSFTAVGDTLDKALETAALLLACDDAPWEEDRYLKQQRAGRTKK